MLDSAKTRFPEPLDSSYSTITGITSSSAFSTVTSDSKKKNVTDDISKEKIREIGAVRNAALVKRNTPSKRSVLTDEHDDWEVDTFF